MKKNPWFQIILELMNFLIFSESGQELGGISSSPPSAWSLSNPSTAHLGRSLSPGSGGHVGLSGSSGSAAAAAAAVAHGLHAAASGVPTSSALSSFAAPNFVQSRPPLAQTFYGWY